MNKIGHWPLTHHNQDMSSHGQHAIEKNIRFDDGALFNGVDSLIHLPDLQQTDGTRPFTLSMQFQVHDEGGVLPGGLCSRYDEEKMAGWHLSLLTQAGVTSTQANWRHLQFGWSSEHPVDNWELRGTPGNSRMVCALCVYEGELYAGVFDDIRDHRGRVYKLGENNEWIDCGNPDQSNSVWTLAEFNGQLYAGTMRYKASGSALEESPNMEPGGRIYRYEGGTSWSLFAELPEADSVGALGVYQESLIAMPYYSSGFYAFDKDGNGEAWGAPGPENNTRTMTLAAYQGQLFAGCNESEGVYSRTFDEAWTYRGKVEKCDQVYCFTVFQNQLLMGVWPEARMLRYEGQEQWSDFGLMGSELEVMGVSVFNGMLYGGTLPGGHVYRYSGDKRWELSGVLEEQNPSVRYRRVWSMAVFEGSLFAGTLPGGKVWSLQNDPLVTYDHSLSSGWHQAIMTYDLNQISLYLDGKLIGSSSFDDSTHSDLSNTLLTLGKGPQSHFSGKIREVELFDTSMTSDEIKQFFQTGQ